MPSILKKRRFALTLIILYSGYIHGQANPAIGKETVRKPAQEPQSKFDQFNKKAEHLFKILPVPLYAYNDAQAIYLD